MVTQKPGQLDERRLRGRTIWKRVPGQLHRKGRAVHSGSMSPDHVSMQRLGHANQLQVQAFKFKVKLNALSAAHLSQAWVAIGGAQCIPHATMLKPQDLDHPHTASLQSLGARQSRSWGHQTGRVEWIWLTTGRVRRVVTVSGNRIVIVCVRGLVKPYLGAGAQPHLCRAMFCVQ
jgi:hypothetical protein